MDERLALTVRKLGSVAGVRQFGVNARDRGLMTDALQTALNARAGELMQAQIAEKLGVSLSDLTAAERKLLGVVSEYAAIKAREGINANRTLEQIKRNGLIGAAEAAVARSRPTAGYETLRKAGRPDLTYEQIIVEHADEFSPAAVWHARNTLGLRNNLPRPPTTSRKPQKEGVGIDAAPDHGDQYWVLICNPKKWAIDRFLRTNTDFDTWGVRPSDRHRFAPGQLALIRVGVDRRNAIELAGSARLEPGIYAVCQIESEAFDAAGAADTFWAEGEKRETVWPTVQIRYLRNLLDQPLSIERLRQEAAETSPYLLNGFQASSMPISGSDFRRVLELLGKSTDDIPTPPGCDLAQADLAALEDRYRRASPEVKSRVSRSIERGRVGALAKRVNEFRCQICDAFGLDAVGFKKLNGEPYVEAHHVMPVARGEVGSLSASNIMTLCADHHRQMHFGNVVVRINAAHFEVGVEGETVRIPRLACDTQPRVAGITPGSETAYSRLGTGRQTADGT